MEGVVFVGHNLDPIVGRVFAFFRDPVTVDRDGFRASPRSVIPRDSASPASLEAKLYFPVFFVTRQTILRGSSLLLGLISPRSSIALIVLRFARSLFCRVLLGKEFVKSSNYPV
jgi:hypothetical protein